MQDRTRVGGTGPSRSRASARASAPPARGQGRSRPPAPASRGATRPDRRPRGRGTPPELVHGRPRRVAATTAASSTVASRGIASDFTATYHGSGSQPRARQASSTAAFTGWVSSALRPGDQAAGGGEDPCGFGQSGRRVGEVVDRERGDHGVERAVAEGEDSRVTGRGRWPTGRVVPQHPDGDVDGDGGSSAGRLGRPARGSGTGAEIEHGSAGDAARAVVDEHQAQLVVDPARTGLPGPAGRGVGVGEGPPVARRSAMPRARSTHQASSSSSPSAFSQPNCTTAPSRQRPTWRSHQPVVSTPRRSSADRRSSMVDSFECPTGASPG